MKQMLVSEIVAKTKSNYLNEIPLSEAEVNELTESIRTEGIKVPLLVQKKTGLLIDGYNRLAIAKKLKLVEVPVDEQDIKDSDIELTQYMLQVSRRNINPADRKLLIGRLINLKKLRAKDTKVHGMKPGAAKFAGKVAAIIDDSDKKLTVKEAQKLVKTKGLAQAQKHAKEISKTSEPAKAVVAKIVTEKKTNLTAQQVLEPIMAKFESAFDEYPKHQKEFKEILKSFLANV